MNLSAEGAEPEANARNAFATGERRNSPLSFPIDRRQPARLLVALRGPWARLRHRFPPPAYKKIAPGRCGAASKRHISSLLTSGGAAICPQIYSRRAPRCGSSSDASPWEGIRWAWRKVQEKEGGWRGGGACKDPIRLQGVPTGSPAAACARSALAAQSRALEMRAWARARMCKRERRVVSECPREIECGARPGRRVRGWIGEGDSAESVRTRRPIESRWEE